MKKIYQLLLTLTIIISFPLLSWGQVDTLFRGYLSPFIQTGGTNPSFNFSGVFRSDANLFNGTEPTVSDSIFLLIRTNDQCYELKITNFSSTGSIISGTAYTDNTGLATINTGFAAIYEKTKNRKLPAYIAGVPETMQECIDFIAAQISDEFIAEPDQLIQTVTQLNHGFSKFDAVSINSDSVYIKAGAGQGIIGVVIDSIDANTFKIQNKGYYKQIDTVPFLVNYDYYLQSDSTYDTIPPALDNKILAFTVIDYNLILIHSEFMQQKSNILLFDSLRNEHTVKDTLVAGTGGGSDDIIAAEMEALFGTHNEVIVFMYKTGLGSNFILNLPSPETYRGKRVWVYALDDDLDNSQNIQVTGTILDGTSVIAVDTLDSGDFFSYTAVENEGSVFRWIKEYNINSDNFAGLESDPIWISDSATYASKSLLLDSIQAAKDYADANDADTQLTPEQVVIINRDTGFIERQELLDSLSNIVTVESDPIWISDSADYAQKTYFLEVLADTATEIRSAISSGGGGADLSTLSLSDTSTFSVELLQDSTAVKRRIWQYDVQTRADIVGKNYPLGSRIKVADTGAEYMVQADSVAGYTTDSIAVIPLVSGYGVLQAGEGSYTVDWFGASGDYQSLSNLSITAGASTVTCTDCFTSDDVGKQLIIHQAGYLGDELVSTITGYSNSSTVTIDSTASYTVSSNTGGIGTDNRLSFQKAINYLKATNVNTWQLNKGNYYVDVRNSNSIKILDDTSRIFDGNDASVYFMSAKPKTYIDVSGGPTNTCFYIYHGDNLTFKNFNARTISQTAARADTLEEGYYSTNDGFGNKVPYNRLYNKTANTGEFLYFSTSTNISVSDNYSKDVGEFLTTTSSRDSIHTFSITNNVIDGWGKVAMFPPENSQVFGNIFDNGRSNYVSTDLTNNDTSSSHAIYQSFNHGNSIISNNIFRNIRVAAYQSNNSLSTDRGEVIISNNLFDSCTFVLSLLGSSSELKAVFSNNIIKSSGSIFIDGNVQSTIKHNNFLGNLNTESAISINSTSSQGTLIQGNFFDFYKGGSNTAIFFISGTALDGPVSIYHNKFGANNNLTIRDDLINLSYKIEFVENTGYANFVINSPGATIKENFIVRNNYFETDTSFIFTLWSPIQIENNTLIHSNTIGGLLTVVNNNGDTTLFRGNKVIRESSTPLFYSNTTNFKFLKVTHNDFYSTSSYDGRGDFFRSTFPAPATSFLYETDTLLTKYGNNFYNIDGTLEYYHAPNLQTAETLSKSATKVKAITSDGYYVEQSYTSLADSLGVFKIVSTRSDIINKNYPLGSRIKVADTGAEYLVQADSVAGYVTDSIAVIPLVSGYAVLQAGQDGFYNVDWFGAVGDLQAQTLSITSSTVTCSSCFSSSDVGKKVIIHTAGLLGDELITTITGYTNENTVTVDSVASYDRTDVSGFLASDNKDEIQNAINFLKIIDGVGLRLNTGSYFADTRDGDIQILNDTLRVYDGNGSSVYFLSATPNSYLTGSEPINNFFYVLRSDYLEFKDFNVYTVSQREARVDTLLEGKYFSNDGNGNSVTYNRLENKTANTGAFAVCTNSTNFKIHDNYASYVILVQNSGAPDSSFNFQIHDNYVNGWATTPIFPPKESIVANNVLDNRKSIRFSQEKVSGTIDGDYGSSHAIYQSSAAGNTLIVGNVIKGANINAYQSNTGVTENRGEVYFVGNYIDSCLYASTLIGDDSKLKMTILGNTIINSGPIIVNGNIDFLIKDNTFLSNDSIVLSSISIGITDGSVNEIVGNYFDGFNPSASGTYSVIVITPQTLNGDLVFKNNTFGENNATIWRQDSIAYLKHKVSWIGNSGEARFVFNSSSSVDSVANRIIFEENNFYSKSGFIFDTDQAITINNNILRHENSAGGILKYTPDSSSDTLYVSNNTFIKTNDNPFFYYNAVSRDLLKVNDNVFESRGASNILSGFSRDLSATTTYNLENEPNIDMWGNKFLSRNGNKVLTQAPKQYTNDELSQSVGNIQAITSEGYLVKESYDDAIDNVSYLNRNGSILEIDGFIELSNTGTSNPIAKFYSSSDNYINFGTQVGDLIFQFEDINDSNDWDIRRGNNGTFQIRKDNSPHYYIDTDGTHHLFNYASQDKSPGTLGYAATGVISIGESNNGALMEQSYASLADSLVANGLATKLPANAIDYSSVTESYTSTYSLELKADDTQVKRRIWQYDVQTRADIVGKNYPLGSRIKVADTGAEYLVQADTVAGFAVDDTVVITLVSGLVSRYARLMPQSGKIHLSHIDESGIGLQKAIDYVEALITSPYEYGKTLRPNEIAPVPYSVLITSTVVIDREITVPDFVMLEGVTANYVARGNQQPGLIFNLNDSTKTGITFSSGDDRYSQAGGIRNLRLTPISESYAALNFINPNSKVVEHITIARSNIDSVARFKFGIIIEGSVFQRFSDIRIDAVDSVGLYIKRNEFILGTTLSFDKLTITGRRVSKHNLFIESNSYGTPVTDIVFHDAAFENTTHSAIKITPYFGNIVFNNIYTEDSARDKTEAIIEIGVGDTIGLEKTYSSLTINGGEISYRYPDHNDSIADFAINADWVDNLSINGVYHNGQNEYYFLKTSKNTKSVTLKDCMLFATYVATNLGPNAASFHRNELDSVYDLSVVRMDNVLSINGAVKVPLNFIGNGTFFAPDMKTDTTFAIVALADDSTLAKITYNALADTLKATNNVTSNIIPYWDGDSWEDSNINSDHSSTGDGSNNVWFGSATNGISSGTNNTAIGHYSMYLTTDGNYNTALGAQAGFNITSGSENVLIGASAGQSIATNSYNTILGYSAGENTTGSGNSILGRYGLFHNSSGEYNVAIGSNAGFNKVGGGGLTSANNSIFIGAFTEAKDVGQTNQIVIGYNAKGNGDNTTTIGNNNTTATYLYGDLRLPSSGAYEDLADSLGVFKIESYTSLADSLVANGLDTIVAGSYQKAYVDFGVLDGDTRHVEVITAGMWYGADSLNFTDWNESYLILDSDSGSDPDTITVTNTDGKLIDGMKYLVSGHLNVDPSGNNRTVKVALRKNGTVINSTISKAYSLLEVNRPYVPITMNAIISLNVGDVLELVVTANDNAVDVLIDGANISITELSR